MESRPRLCVTALIVFCLVACGLIAQTQQPNLSGLNSDDRNSIDLACVIAKGDGPAAYHACLQKQLRAMSGSSPSWSIGIEFRQPNFWAGCQQNRVPASFHLWNRPMCREWLVLWRPQC